jgi:sugar phosphate permease
LDNTKKNTGVYFGWWLNLATSIISGTANGFTQGISVFFKPIAAELGLSRAVTSVASSIARLEGGMEAPIVGVLADKISAKWIMITGAIFFGTGLVLMNFVVDSVWSYYLIWGLLVGTGNNLGFTIVVDKVLTNWFIRKRGLSYGMRFAILGLMQVAMLPVVSWLTVSLGWRQACLICGIIAFATIPFTLYFVRNDRPEDRGLLPDGDRAGADLYAFTDREKPQKAVPIAGPEEMKFSLKQAMKTSSFWILTLCRCSFVLIIGGFNLHCINFLTDRGIELAAAASLMSMMVFFTIPSRFLFGFFADHLNREHQKFLLTGAFLLMAMGISAFIIHQTTAMIYVFLILWGLGYGGITPADITIRTRYFGRKSYGSIQGITNLVAAPFSFFGPIYAGWVFDIRGDYTSAFISFAAIAAFAAMVISLVQKPKPPAG